MFGPNLAPDADQGLDTRFKTLSHEVKDVHLKIVSEQGKPMVETLLRHMDRATTDGRFDDARGLADDVINEIVKDYRNQVALRGPHLGLLPDHVSQYQILFPGSDTRTLGGLSPTTFLLLGLVPHDRDLLFKKLLPQNPNRVATVREEVNSFLQRLAEGSILPDDPVTWYFAAVSVRRGTYVDQRGVLNQVREFADLSEDASKRCKAASQTVTALRDSFKAYKDFGSDVPVVIIPYEQKVYVLENAPLFVGHHVSVCYNEGLEHYKIHFAHSGRTGLEGAKFSPYVLNGGDSSGTYRVGREMILFRRSDVRAVLDQLRREGLVPFQPVGTTDEPLEKLPFNDPFATPNLFFGRTATYPLIATSEFKVELELKTFDAGKDVKRLALGNMKAPLSRNHFLVVGPAHAELPGFQGADRTLKRALDRALTEMRQRIKAGRVIIWENGRATIVFNRPFEVPRETIMQPLSGKREGNSTKIYGLQSLYSARYWSLLTEQPAVSQGAPRFGFEDLVISYDSKLPLGCALNRRALELVQDERLEHFGFRRIHEEKYNAITDGWTSIPLEKPSSQLFDNQAFLSEFPHLKALRHLPKRDWLITMLELQGSYLNSIQDIDVERRSSEAKVVEHDGEEAVGESEKALETRECFIGPRVDFIGRWIVSHCEVEGRPFYVVDSRSYGNALFIFRSLGAAERAAGYFSKGEGPREEVQRDPDFVIRLVHQPGWKDRLDTAIRRHIIGIE